MRALLVGLCLAIGAGGALAQQPERTPPAAAAPQGAATLLTVDIDRLFGQSRFGERIARTYTEGRTALAAENRRIAEALRQEELALADQRAQMAPAVFQAEAAAFDEKAQSIRRAQDAKEAALDDTLDEGRAQFLEVSRPILIQLMSDRNAAAILDRRSVLLSLERIDITDEAIARIDETIGDGTEDEDEN
ncbi:OmpH family outer membrane protein [Thalassorhabdomicrobium marinisediminis]|uniref:OmpH family outer membrane protein n=1 Tax=Thalassorhabdomicrobium marinisediminis TaxID=2170577 RepID=UPI002491A20B|nr:OmpH family outer membrane protein [Thalassorhabdomicrobium marinisediminis]